MKKYLIALSLVGLATTSCYEKLNIAPPNAITDEQVQALLKTADEATVVTILGGMADNIPTLFKGGGYTTFNNQYFYNYQAQLLCRNITGNDLVTSASDYTAPSGDHGNLYAGINLNGASEEVSSAYWTRGYSLITSTNKVMNYLTDELLNENASLTLRKYKGWGQVMRAYAYNYLMECYVDSYTNGGSSKLGLSIYTKYSINNPPVARSSAKETYDSILTWAKDGVKLLKDAQVGYTKDDPTDIDLGVCNFNLLRVALCAGDWTTAITAGNELVAQYTKFIPKANYGWQGSKTGNLQNPISIPASGNYFLNVEKNPEVIMGWPYAQAAVQSVGSSNIEPTCIWMNPFGKGGGGLFSAIDQSLYNKMDDDDYRKNLFATTAYGSYAYPPNGTRANVPAWVNFKWANTYGIAGKAGEALSSSTVDQVGQYVMRASEAYLMLAEAQYRSGATGDAATTLNKLISARTDGAKDASNYNGGGDLWEMIKLQYRIEMWGEGREFYNNKRWNIPINRNKDYHPNATTLTFPVSGMVCKIPENEINYNPLVVQNP